MELDWVIGSIMESVKALGIMEDTIIVFSSDNGAACVGAIEQCGPNAANVSETPSWPGTVQPN